MPDTRQRANQSRSTGCWEIIDRFKRRQRLAPFRHSGAPRPIMAAPNTIANCWLPVTCGFWTVESSRNRDSARSSSVRWIGRLELLWNELVEPQVHFRVARGSCRLVLDMCRFCDPSCYCGRATKERRRISVSRHNMRVNVRSTSMRLQLYIEKRPHPESVGFADPADVKRGCAVSTNVIDLQTSSAISKAYSRAATLLRLLMPSISFQTA